MQFWKAKFVFALLSFFFLSFLPVLKATLDRRSFFAFSTTTCATLSKKSKTQSQLEPETASLQQVNKNTSSRAVGKTRAGGEVSRCGLSVGKLFTCVRCCYDSLLSVLHFSSLIGFPDGFGDRPGFLTPELRHDLDDAAAMTSRALAVVRRAIRADEAVDREALSGEERSGAGADTGGRSGEALCTLRSYLSSLDPSHASEIYEEKSLCSLFITGFRSASVAVEISSQKRMSPVISIMQPILRFLQLLCENHNPDLQNYLRVQQFKPSYNLVCETLQFLDCICGSTTGGLGLLGLYINEQNVSLINQTLESLTEYCQVSAFLFQWSTCLGNKLYASNLLIIVC